MIQEIREAEAYERGRQNGRKTERARIARELRPMIREMRDFHAGALGGPRQPTVFGRWATELARVVSMVTDHE